MIEGIAAREWPYTVILHGNIVYRCSLNLHEDRLLWHARPEDPDEEKILDCAQGFADFREFGPPETPTSLGIPVATLSEVCGVLDCRDAAWRDPLPAPIQEWFAAVEAGDIGRMQNALANGVDVNAVDRQHRSALWQVASERGTRLTGWLLEHKADPNLRDRYGRTPLMNTAFSSDTAKATLYLRNGADKTIRDAQGRTAYLLAVELKASGALQQVLCTYEKKDWEHALHLAAWNSHTVWLDGESWYVEAHSPDVNTIRSGRTPLQSCLEGHGRHPWAARWLVEQGADLTIADMETPSTILHLAARENMPWLVTACVSAGVDVNARRADGHTALSIALDFRDRPGLLRALLHAGADPAMVVSGPDGLETISAKAIRCGLIWSEWMLSKFLFGWTGLVCHAVAVPFGAEPVCGADPTDAFWIEFPAEWCTGASLQTWLADAAIEIAGKSCTIVRVLTWTEASKAPWSWPGRKLWALLPDKSVRPIDHHRDARPRSIVSDPRAFQPGAIENIERTWKWPGQAWDGRHDTYSVSLRHGLITWEAYNYRVEMAIDQFRVGGPPHGAGADRSLPREIADEISAAIGDWKRKWEIPSSNEARKKRLEEWLAAQPKPLAETQIPEAVPHQSGLWCYARADINDHFNTLSGAGSDGTWSCWLEFPAEWCAVRRPYREHWLRAALGRAYAAMNENTASDPEGGTYVFQRAFFTVLPLAEAKRQPWREKGKILYLVTDRPVAPKSAEGAERLRSRREMADPDSPPNPIPVSPPPFKGTLRT